MLGLANGINGPSMIDIGNIYQSSISVISKVIAFGSGGGLVGGFLGTYVKLTTALIIFKSYKGIGHVLVTCRSDGDFTK